MAIENQTPEEELLALAPRAVDRFTQKALEGTARALADRDNPLRVNFFSAGIRIFFEHLMGALAPPDEVKACPWFQAVKDTKGPTRAQRIQYCLQGGIVDQFLEETLDLEPKALRRQLIAAFDNLSKHVHGREDTIILDGAAQDQEARSTVEAVAAFLNAYHECRAALLEPLAETLDDAAVDELMQETIQSIDELATHHSIEEIYVGETEVVSIGSESVRYRANGTIRVILQWGSNSDLRRDEGAEMGQSFPFECVFDVPVESPQDLSEAEVVSGVDTSSWYGDYDEGDRL